MLRRALPLPALLLALALLLLAAPAGASAHKAHHKRGHVVHAGACAAAHVAMRHGAIRRARIATLCLLNRQRSHYGLRPLRLNPRLAHAARLHSHDMVHRRYFAHDSLNGRTPFQRMFHVGYVPRNSSWWLGENIGWGVGPLAEPAALVRAWMHSPPHRANILSRHFREIGIGIVLGAPSGHWRSPGATYTTDFGEHS